MNYETKNSNKEVKVIVVPIEEICPGIEDRYRKMLDIARKQGRWPPKNCLTDKKLEKIARQESVFIQPISKKLEKNYAKMVRAAKLRDYKTKISDFVQKVYNIFKK